VRLTDGSLGRASVASDALASHRGAVEQRDGGERYAGAGVRQAVANVNSVLAPAVIGLDPTDQAEVDGWLIEVDGTADKRRLGGNAVLAVSLATCRAAAASRGLPPYRHIAILAGITRPTVPLPMVSVAGGVRAAAGSDIRELFVIPTAATSFGEAMEHVSAVQAIAAGLRRPARRAEDRLRWVAEAIAGGNVDAEIGIDVSAARLLTPDARYRLPSEDRVLDTVEMVDLLVAWSAAAPIASIQEAGGS